MLKIQPKTAVLIFQILLKSCELLNPSNKYIVGIVAQYCSHLGLTKKIDLLLIKKIMYLRF